MSLAETVALEKQRAQFSKVWVTALSKSDDIPGVIALAQSLMHVESRFCRMKFACHCFVVKMALPLAS